MGRLNSLDKPVLDFQIYQACLIQSHVMVLSIWSNMLQTVPEQNI